MMRKYRILGAFIVVPAAYVTGAFIAADWDIAAWDTAGRYFTAVFAWMGVAALLTFP